MIGTMSCSLQDPEAYGSTARNRKTVVLVTGVACCTARLGDGGLHSPVSANSSSRLDPGIQNVNSLCSQRSLVE